MANKQEIAKRGGTVVIWGTCRILWRVFEFHDLH